jgi:multidrug efflux pump subunit AcrB
MDSLHWSGRSPIGVIVIAVFLGLLGLLSLSRLPLQLFPDINRPELSIQTGWRTASPEEVGIPPGQYRQHFRYTGSS